MRNLNNRLNKMERQHGIAWNDDTLVYALVILWEKPDGPATVWRILLESAGKEAAEKICSLLGGK